MQDAQTTTSTQNFLNVITRADAQPPATARDNCKALQTSAAEREEAEDALVKQVPSKEVPHSFSTIDLASVVGNAGR